MNKQLNNETTYDSVFWSSLTKMKRFAIPLINEAFGEHYAEGTEVILQPLKQVVRKTDESLKEDEVDSLITILSEDGDHTKYYHFECQDWGESRECAMHRLPTHSAHPESFDTALLSIADATASTHSSALSQKILTGAIMYR